MQNTTAFLSKTQDLCNLYSSATISALESYLTSSLPLPSSPSDPNSPSSVSLSPGAIVGIVVGLSSLFVIVPVTTAAYRDPTGVSLLDLWRMHRIWVAVCREFENKANLQCR